MRLLSCIVCLAGSVQGQSFNIDLGDNTAAFPVPSAAYGGAAIQPGPWNALASPFNATLTSTTGLPTNVTITCESPATFGYANGPLTGDDRNLMYDGMSLPEPGGPYTITFRGFAAGSYTVFTYAWSPLDPAARTRVSVQGSIDPPVLVGGTWNGSPHVLDVTYVAHSAPVLAGGVIRIDVQGVGGPGSINCIQIRGTPATPSFCWAGSPGSACPCGPTPIPRGCGNSVYFEGAELTSTGIPSISSDTLRLQVGLHQNSGLPNASGLFFQGTNQVQGGSGVAFGDGLRCVGGSIMRIAIVAPNGQGYALYPRSASDPSVSLVGGVAAGDVRHYQFWYRDPNPGFCTPATFNLTNGITALWQP